MRNCGVENSRERERKDESEEERYDSMIRVGYPPYVTKERTCINSLYNELIKLWVSVCHCLLLLH